MNDILPLVIFLSFFFFVALFIVGINVLNKKLRQWMMQRLARTLGCRYTPLRPQWIFGDMREERNGIEGTWQGKEVLVYDVYQTRLLSHQVSSIRFLGRTLPQAGGSTGGRAGYIVISPYKQTYVNGKYYKSFFSGLLSTRKIQRILSGDIAIRETKYPLTVSKEEK